MITQKPLLKKEKQRINLELKLKNHGSNLNSKENAKLKPLKNDLETIYDHTVDGIKIRSECEWYEHLKRKK